MAGITGNAPHQSRMQAEVEEELRIPTADEQDKPTAIAVELGEATYTKMLSRRD